MKLSMTQRPEIDRPDDDGPDPPLPSATEVMEESMITATRHLAAIINRLPFSERPKRFATFIEKLAELEEEPEGDSDAKNSREEDATK